MNEVNIRAVGNYKYKTQEPTGINHIAAIPVRALLEDGKTYGEYRTLNLAKAYTGVSRDAILRSLVRKCFVKTRKGQLKFERIV